MEKGPDFSSRDGYPHPDQEAYPGQSQPNPLISRGHGGHNTGLDPRGDVSYRYGQPAASDSILSNDYHLPNPLGTGIRVQPSPSPLAPPSIPVREFPTWHPGNRTATSGLVIPQEIQFQEVVGQPGGPSSIQLLYQGFQQRRIPGMNTNSLPVGELSSRNSTKRMNLQQENSTASAELQLGTWTNPANPGRPLANSLYDPKYAEMGLPVDPHLRMFLVKHGRGAK